MSRKTPKFEALVVNAIRRLQAAQGSTANEIANYLSQEYDVSGPEIRRMIQLTIRRGLNYGILQKSKRGYTTCDRSVTDDPIEEDCFECRVRRRRGGERLSTRRARSKRRGGYRAMGRPTPRTTTTAASRKRVRRAAPRHVRRAPAVTRKARTGRGLAGKQTNRRPTNLEKAKQKKQTEPDNASEPPDNASTTSTNHGGRTSSKSPIRKESETNQDS